MELNIGHSGITRQSWSRDNIRVIWREIKEAHPKASLERLARILSERLRDDVDLLDAAADYIASNMEAALMRYGAKESAPVAPRKTEAERQRGAATRTATVESIKQQIMLLNMEMPNGKRLRYCTGTEVLKFGDGFRRIGKKAGTKMVGSVLNENEVRALMAK